MSVVHKKSATKIGVLVQLTVIVCAVGIALSGGTAAAEAPSDFPLSDSQYNAIDSDGDGQISLAEFSAVQRAYVNDGTYNGATFTRVDIVALENYLIQSGTSTDIQWTGGGTNGPAATQDIQVEPNAGSIKFGGSTDRSIRIENVDSGESVTLTPQNQSYDVTQFEINFNSLTSVTDGTRTQSEDPTIGLTTDGEQQFVFNYPVSVSGDPVSFYDSIFSTYRVELVDNSGTVIASTDDPLDSGGTRIRGAGYTWSYEYNGSALAITRNSAVKSDWYVELTQGDVTIPVDNTAGDKYFIVDTAGTNFNQGDNADETFRLQMYPSQSDTSNDKVIINLFEVDGVKDENTVEGPVGNKNSDDGTNDNNSGSDDSGSGDSGGSSGQSDTVALSGSNIALQTGGGGSFGVDNLPDDVSVSSISGSGAVPPANPDGIVWQSLTGLPAEVSFTLTPGSSYSAGDTITFTAGGEQKTVTVKESVIPSDVPDTVNATQYNGWAGSDNSISQSEAINGFNGWFSKGSYNGVSYSQSEALDLFGYWFSN
jgi:hypothetical protein